MIEGSINPEGSGEAGQPLAARSMRIFRLVLPVAATAVALAATKAALDAAGGTFTVTGMAGSGASFRLSLPCVPIPEGVCP